MAQNKLERFAQLDTFANTIQPKLENWFDTSELKGKWGTEIFKNDNPIVLELGCGKGEYTVGLGRQYPDKNFIGVDRKGNRIWRGAKTALEDGLDNIRFLRVMIDKIDQFFAPGEVSEIWITFPDPQPQLGRAKKRLTAPKFLAKYKNTLPADGIIHLKTDSQLLHEYTLEVIEEGKHKLLFKTNDLYAHPENKNDPILSIRTYYEGLFLEQGMPITYIKFQLA
ncbi:MAG: tRNA (guanosine(46)-N7)-methyltransferase TrmB [Sphingobacteriales bacterium JAD_PAG50586_3]|nr:MAG: tRNA (guanosine(46)-N7)-methyltransferase TrmB [Sphingobacteriales bacterium JAD_PAG50586_3]